MGEKQSPREEEEAGLKEGTGRIRLQAGPGNNVVCTCYAEQASGCTLPVGSNGDWGEGGSGVTGLWGLGGVSFRYYTRDSNMGNSHSGSPKTKISTLLSLSVYTPPHTPQRIQDAA